MRVGRVFFGFAAGASLGKHCVEFGDQRSGRGDEVGVVRRDKSKIAGAGGHFEFFGLVADQAGIDAVAAALDAVHDDGVVRQGGFGDFCRLLQQGGGVSDIGAQDVAQDRFVIAKARPRLGKVDAGNLPASARGLAAGE